jgi:hypothetical protein
VCSRLEQSLLRLLVVVHVQEAGMCSLMNYTAEERPELQLPHLIQLADKVGGPLIMLCMGHITTNRAR